MSKALAKADSDPYRPGFYGILSAQGQFWTVLAFDTREKARQHIVDFWGLNAEYRDKCLRTHKIVPVRITLEQLPEEPKP